MDIEHFKNIHKGKRAFVLGNGPSLNKIDLDLLKDEITFGGNNIFLHETFIPKYYSIEDWNAIKNNYRYINQWNKPEYKFVAKKFASDYIKGDNVVHIRFKRWRKNSNEIKMSCNKENAIFYWMSTVTNLLIQLAYYMGCNPIYLIGVDHFTKTTSEPLKHFVDNYVTNDIYNQSNIDIMNEGYRVNRDELGKRDYRIYNLTPNSYLNVYDKLNFDDVI